MRVSDFIRELKNYRQDQKIEIECPNGLMVDPRIKVQHENPMDPFSKPTGYVVTWRD